MTSTGKEALIALTHTQRHTHTEIAKGTSELHTCAVTSTSKEALITLAHTEQHIHTQNNTFTHRQKTRGERTGRQRATYLVPAERTR